MSCLYSTTPHLLSMHPPLPLLITLTVTFLTVAYSQPTTTTTSYPGCNLAFSCGAITNVTYPFTGGDRPSYCGHPQFQLTCRDYSTTELSHNGLTYLVTQLNQTQNSLGLSRLDLYNNSCPSRFRNTTLDSTIFNYLIPQNEVLNLFYGCNTTNRTVNSRNAFSCYSSELNSTDGYRLIGAVPSDPVFGILSCSVSINVPVIRSAAESLMNLSIGIGEALMEGFIVNYSAPNESVCSECTRLGGNCGFNTSSVQPLCICGDMPCAFTITLPHGVLGALPIVAFLILAYCYGNKCTFNDPNEEGNIDVESFILDHGSLAPKRYRYRELKKLTKSFTNKLGQGGFGSVYKGTLPDGRFVAVKVLSETSNAEEFINEVASISRTSHVNIVNLLGFCYSKNKRALVYEYMPNKSLDKFIYKKGDHLGWDKLYNIAVGVARGLEYLHTGCNERIIHFDIKPQNVLLDEDFSPKISDFGLAKLCRKKHSIISSVFGLRGTFGYIAPEVFCRNFGRVTHKCDVYSYGMMLLEMAGAREINEAAAIQSSENFFPDKIYELGILCKTEKFDKIVFEEEYEIIMRKMFLIGFWCIQTDPLDRPSMSKVVEMLEGSMESVQVPPKPSLSSPMLAVQQFLPSKGDLETEDSFSLLISNPIV